jgi:hypothetical protein
MVPTAPGSSSRWSADAVAIFRVGPADTAGVGHMFDPGFKIASPDIAMRPKLQHLESKKCCGYFRIVL